MNLNTGSKTKNHSKISIKNIFRQKQLTLNVSEY